ncbi:MAG TPA: beta-ketoacyl-[acyl-carrier-protein] synthase family protein [Vicinamibacterales bacterium]|nr:beta-ketoacyl-[acyl-carrier-protein] synthase family protein [Vicinamibacterales bacterium]
MGLNVAITGMGVVSALGCTPSELLARLRADEIAIEETPWTRDDPERHEWWAPVKDFDPSRWLDGKLVDGTAPHTQFALAAISDAVRESGIELDPLRTAVIVGSTIAGTQLFERSQYDVDRLGREGVLNKVMIKAWANMAAAQVAMRWGLHGPTLTITTACASGIDAIGIAARYIAAGLADIALVGGTEGGISYGVGDNGFIPASAFSRYDYNMCGQTRDPRTACQPFDRNRLGMVYGEGAGMFVLERADRARARGARVLGYVQGYGNGADGYHPSTPDPSGDWEKRVMELALAEAGIGAARISAIVAHGTGTPKGDIAEIRAINNLFRDRSRPVPVMSVKGTLGHPTGSAGALSLVVGLQGMREAEFPFTGATVEADPEVEFDLVMREPRKMDIEWLQLNAFGFGGQNASLVVSAKPR